MAWTDPHLHSARSLLDLPVNEANRRVMAHREAFLGAGAAHEARPVIAASWARVRELGVDPAAERAPLVMSLENIDEILRTQQLGRSGRQVLDRFAPLAEGSRHVIVLADDRGRILYEVGHRGVYEGLEAMNFVPGGDWSEGAVGPNGIGTPLSLGRPEMVLGAEHYCEGWQPWVCYGAPVCDPETGRPLGAVDITGPSGAADIQTLALAISIAQSLEQQLELQTLQNRDHLRSEFREMERRWPGDALMLLSDGGRVLDINGVAVQMLELDRVVHAERPLATVLPDLWLLARDLVQTGRYGERRGEIRLENGMQPQLECRVQPVHHGQRKIGAVLILSGFHRLLSGTATRQEPRAPARLVTLDDILGNSPSLAAAKRLCTLAAHDGGSVLLVGETGTGKEMFAQGIHSAGPKRTRPFIALNCGALPRELAASELFGYEPGSFTGADRKGRAGKFEVADGGTLFLDEVDSLDPDVQAKLLRVLEDMRVYRIGNHHGRAVDVRVIAAAGPRLAARLADGSFRLDLYHRLNVIDIHLPPLRDRPEDIALLAQHFLERECRRRGVPLPAIDPAVLSAFSAYHWPGNVRELANVCRRALLVAQGNRISDADLPELLKGHPVPAENMAAPARRSLRSISDDAIRAALEAADGNLTEAARRLGINRTTIYRRQQRWRC